MKRPRRFTLRQRIALIRAQGFRCANCGCELEPGWHADHILPYAVGGATDVINGQALCPKCNITKGACIVSIERHNRYRWQDDCVADAIETFKTKPDYSLSAAPGSGKTICSLKIFVATRQLGWTEKL